MFWFLGLSIPIFSLTTPALPDKVKGVTITGVVACKGVAPNVIISYYGDKQIKQTTTDKSGMFMLEGLVLTKKKPILHLKYNCSNLCSFSYTFNDLKKYKNGEVYDFGPIQLANPHLSLKSKKC
ncbi:unnamed protein product [Cylicocyclus nassatus]|uniref:Transthyretin n=1 Tax=Cylicocyclus nassatus TaxID=53992 RepID=A0AA36M597_CYLNA|nr:unnamed protein product [Cylicocyclus nassatus]